MPSHYIYVPVLILCAPLILSVIGTFTALAIFTSSLALIVISIRLGFLAIEFSGGFVLDFIRCCINRILGENPCNNNKQHDKKKEKKDKPHYHGKKYQHKTSSNKGCISTKLTPSRMTPSKMTPLLENIKVYEFGNNFVSNDDYFMMSTIANKRPNGRRARSDYI